MSDKLREQFEQLDEDAVTKMIDDPESEGLHIEFKSLDTADPFGRTSDKKNLAKTLSAFANTGGGIAVWGVHDDKYEGERFQDIDPALICKQLNAKEAHVVNPQIPGVLHKICGKYAVSFVPESDTGPHMAIGGSTHDYYMRSGEASVRMEHQQIADMFGRRARPNLIPSLTVTRVHGDYDSPDHCDCELSLGNYGRGVAKYFMIQTLSLSNFELPPNAGAVINRFKLDSRGALDASGNGAVIFAGTDFVIHPGTESRVAPVTIRSRAGLGFNIHARIDVVVAADGIQPRKFTCSVNTFRLRAPERFDFEPLVDD